MNRAARLQSSVRDGASSIILYCPIYLLVSIYFCWPLYAQPDGLGIRDWDQHFFYYASVLKSLGGFAQLPFWNPWYCGGNVLWQNPQIAVLSPVYLLATVVSLPVAMKVTITAHYVASFIGMHLLLTRAFRIGFFPAVLFLGCLYTCAGAHALHLAVGHSTFLPFLLLPLALYFVVRSLQTGAVRDALLAGAVLAFAAYNGGAHALAMAGVAFGVLAVAAASLERRWRPLMVIGVVGISAFLYSAPKLVPVAAFLRSSHFLDIREVAGVDSLTWEEAIRALVDPVRPAGWVGWFEVGNYIGFLGGLVILGSVLAIVTGSWRRDRALGIALAVVGVLMLLFARGAFSAHAPFVLLRMVPGLSTFRSPGRYSILVALFGAALAGAAIEAALAGMTMTSAAKRLVGVVLLLGAFEQASHNRQYFVGAMVAPTLDSRVALFSRSTTPELDATGVSEGPDAPMVRSTAENRDIIDCYEPLRVQRGVVPGRPLVWSPDVATRFFSTTFSPNRIDFTVLTGGAETRVYLNQNYIEGWRSSAGPVLFDPAVGLGYVTFPHAFAGKVSLAFRPPGIWTGVALLVVGLVLSLLVWHHVLD